LKVRLGAKVKFWEDTWIGDIPLNVILPRLYARSNNREQTLIELGSWISEKWCWKLSWRRELFEWEKPQLIEFINILIHNSLHREGEDTWIWKDEERDNYMVKSAYIKLHNTFNGKIVTHLIFTYNIANKV